MEATMGESILMLATAMPMILIFIIQIKISEIYRLSHILDILPQLVKREDNKIHQDFHQKFDLNIIIYLIYH